MTAAIADPLQGIDPLGIVRIPSFVNFDTLVQGNKAAIGIPLSSPNFALRAGSEPGSVAADLINNHRRSTQVTDLTWHS
jgi:hypothetical protein